MKTEIRRYYISPPIIQYLLVRRPTVERYLEEKLEIETERGVMSDGLRADILRIIQ